MSAGETNGWIPEGLGHVVVQDDLLNIVIVINEQTSLVKQDIFNLFSSSQAETGGEIRFPYCRVDGEILLATNNSYLLEFSEPGSEAHDKYYNLTSAAVFKMFVWVEIGCQGFDNFADSESSKNWTRKGAHRLPREEQIRLIKSKGRDAYSDAIIRFRSYKQSIGITDDIFTNYGLGDLLSKFSG